MSPFVAALTGNAAVYPLSSSLANLLTLTLTHESWFALGTMLALVGLLSCVGRGLWFLPVWLAAAELIDARGQMVTLILPVALLVGVGIVDVILPLALADRGADRPRRPVMLVVALVCAVLLVRSLFSTMLYAATQDAAMPAPERTAMAWVSGDTPVGSRFLVYASTSNANTDDVEWFPALTGRISLVTSQGQEWVKGEYARRTRETIALIHCGPELACVQRTLRRFDLHPQYVYLGKPVQHVLCEGLCLSMRQSPGYTLVYDGPGAWIFRLRPG
jgi:hypothetical protein